VSHYVKAIRSYKELKQKIASEALNVVENYVLASWYNHWTSIVIEHFFKQHKKVLPTIGQVKSIDFIIDGIPFDLKVTYLPSGKWYQDGVKSHLTSLGLPNSEIASLRKFAKLAKVRYGKLPVTEQHYQIRKLLENHNANLFKEAIERALTNVSALDRRIIKKKFGIDKPFPMSINEIAENEGISPNKVKYSISNTLKAIEQYMPAIDKKNIREMLG
jgi:hypothetical protein